MPRLAVRRIPCHALVLVVALSPIAPAFAGEGGGSSGSVSRLFTCKMPAREIDSAHLIVDLPGDADQMDGCTFGVAAGKKKVKVDVFILVVDEDADSDFDSDSDVRKKVCRGKTNAGGQFICTLSREEFQALGLNEPLDDAQIEAVLGGGKKIIGFDLFGTCSAGLSSSP